MLKQTPSVGGRSLLYSFTAETLIVSKLTTHKLQIFEPKSWISEFECKDLSECKHHARNTGIQELGLLSFCSIICVWEFKAGLPNICAKYLEVSFNLNKTCWS